MARRDDREYREYLREEQRRQPGCPAREVVLDQRGQATSAPTLTPGTALQQTRLVRVIGRWSLAALMLNTALGASAFGLPSLIAAHLGRLSPAGFLVSAAGIGAVAACLAEVASQFRETS
jgi:hypothetical protein